MSRQHVWESLNDPQTLAACIKYCEWVERTGADSFEAQFYLRAGPLKKTVDARIRVIDIDPPGEYRLDCEVMAGVVGGAGGGADVVLWEVEPTRTRLQYRATVAVSGRLAGIGMRALGGVAERYMQGFFERMVDHLASRTD